VVAGHSTIYVARTEKHFWQKPYPSILLFSATSVTEIIGTLFAIFGVLLVPIGWKYVLLIWGYALAWFILNDFIKIWLYKYLRKEKIIA
jgi:H+-transporting ATPase